MLPTRGRHLGYDLDDLDDLDGRYADEAILLFLQHLRRLGTQPREYVTKMFGGGNQFPGSTSPVLDVSRGNVAVGLRLLRRHRFPLTTQHLGGTGFRRLSLDLATGEVGLTHVSQDS
jgi:chemotaxis protein CheD